MAETSTSEGSARAATSIVPEEIEQFAKLADEWWDPDGSSAMLHKLNPVRLKYLRDMIDQHWQCDEHLRTPLEGKTALDVGCGAGLLTEPLARLGGEVTGLDAAPANAVAAARHAQGSGLAVTYLAGELAALDGRFDLVTCLEVLEHVADKEAFVAELARHLAPGGLLVVSTPNRTEASRLLLVGAAEALGAVPRGTHHWDDFVTPGELRTLLANAGLTMGEPRGIAWSPLQRLHLSSDLSLNYIVAATHA